MSAYNHITRHAAKCAESSQIQYVAWPSRGADGPARRSSSVSRTWWTGPPPSSFTAGCRGPLQDGQAAKAKPLTRSCLRFWTRAWGQRELADEQTGRWISPAWIAGLFQGGLDIPANHVQFQLTPQGTPELDVGRVVACHALGEGELLCLPIVVSFFKRRPSWFIGWLNKARPQCRPAQGWSAVT